jgi:hypothetical protein
MIKNNATVLQKGFLCYRIQDLIELGISEGLDFETSLTFLQAFAKATLALKFVI